MFDPQHFGLYYSPAQVEYAQTHRDEPPFQQAWDWLAQHRELDLLEIALCSALRYRFAGDIEAGERGMNILEHDALRSLPSDPIARMGSLMGYAQAFETLRDYPGFVQQQRWLNDFAALLNEIDTLDANYVEALWRNTLRLIGGIVLEDEARFSQAVEGFSEAVRHDLHPDGYVRKAAVDGDPALSLHRMLLAVQALILCAEAASHAGQDLWALSQRGVSVLTPLPYLLYYYYYPEKWRWDVEVEVEGVPEAGLASLDPQAVQGFYRQHAGLWEMAQHHSLSPDRQRLLDELRPIFDLWGGGLVTLSHGAEPVRHRRFGLF